MVIFVSVTKLRQKRKYKFAYILRVHLQNHHNYYFNGYINKQMIHSLPYVAF